MKDSERTLGSWKRADYTAQIFAGIMAGVASRQEFVPTMTFDEMMNLARAGAELIVERHDDEHAERFPHVG